MPDLVVSGADLDLLELALLPGGPRVPLRSSAVLTDPERTPVAEVGQDGGVRAVRPLAPRPELLVTPASRPEDPAVRAARSALVLDVLPSRSQIALADALPEGPVAWVALVGRERRGVQAGPLLAAVHAAAEAWAARTGREAIVVALPWTLDAAPRVLPLPDALADGAALATWLAGALGLDEVVVLGESDEHRALAALEADAAGAARALLSPEVLPFHRGRDAAGLVVLFTGLSGSGKSTVARAVAARLEERGEVVSVLDGDEVRRLLSAGLGFDAESRALNVRRIGWVAAQIGRAGGAAIAAPIAPFAAGRAEVRRMAEEAGARFVLVHVATPLEVCEARDRKGLYAAARAGRVAEFTGISSPYEAPSDADVTIDTAIGTVDDAAAAVLAVLREGAR